MDYKKLATDLLSVCEENCADCKYAGGSEFECTIAELAATAITGLLARAEAAEKRVEELEKSLSDAAQVVKIMQQNTIPFYERRTEAAEAWAKKAEKERDAAINQIHGFCKACKNYTTDQNEDPCATCKHEYFVYKNIYASDNWEWNGGKKEE